LFRCTRSHLSESLRMMLQKKVMKLLGVVALLVGL